jgi:hypothetical protein
MITRENENIVEGIAINQGYMVQDSAHTLCGNTFSPYHAVHRLPRLILKIREI